MANKDFKFDDAYRKTDEYNMFCECLKNNGVDPLMWEHAIMIHKSQPLLYRKKKHEDDGLQPPKNTKKEFDVVEVLPPVIEGIGA